MGAILFLMHHGNGGLSEVASTTAILFFAALAIAVSAYTARAQHRAGQARK